MDLAKIYSIFKRSKGICTDTRKIEKGIVFLALKGNSFNGNRFVSEAFSKGASYAIVDDQDAVIDDRCILVNDALKTLQQLAKFHSNRIHIPLIAMTGSNGKTTTKELLVSILQQKYNVLYTQGNLNNHIGVPLTILRMKPEHELAVIEMGANHQGEIHQLCQIAEPDYGLITNIGNAHLEGFGGREGVIKGKTELYRYIADNGRLLFVNEQDDLLRKYSREIPRVFYGAEKNNIHLISGSPFITFQFNNKEVETQLTGVYNFQNITAAVGVGQYFRIPGHLIIDSVKHYAPDNNRSQLIKSGTNTIILDSYNANPTSVKAALKNLMNYNSSHNSKVVALGDMLELGNESKDFHKEILQILNEYKFDKVILVGPIFSQVAENSKYVTCNNPEEAVKYLKEHPVSDSVLLIKGSRGIQMEKILKSF